MIVDTYGIPCYLEANPALLTIVTFPFFFGMMFGDMGHGSLYIILGSVLTIGGPAYFKGTLLESFGVARYLLLLMGIMAFYCGFIYNEWFAIPTNWFGSCYDINTPECSTPPSVAPLPPNGDVGNMPCESAEIYRR
jgi:V-type H+-transporting ATPase subunit a